MVKGNGFRALIIGVVVLTAGLYIATDLSQWITPAAQKAGFDMGSATAISSICDGANPLTWAITRLNWINGIAVVGVIAVGLALVNRKKILKEAAEMHAAG